MHRLQDLQISVPFLSNLPDHVTVEVQPRLAFKLDNAAFDSGAQTTPFADDRASQIDIAISGLDLAPWAAYVPASAPFKPLRGTLSTNLQVQFAQPPGGAPRISLRGKVGVADASLSAQTTTAPVVGWRQLDVALVDVQPLARKVALGDVTLAGAQIDARRDAQGRINLVPPRDTATPEPAPLPAAPAASGAPATAAPAPWQLSIAKVALTQARIDWHDAATRPAAALRIEPLDVQLTQVRWPVETSAPFTLDAALAALDAKDNAGSDTARISLQGSVSDRAGDAQAELKGLNLAWLEPYLAATLNARIEGRAAARSNVQWTAGQSATVKLAETRVDLEQLKLHDGGAKARTPLGVASRLGGRRRGGPRGAAGHGGQREGRASVAQRRARRAGALELRAVDAAADAPAQRRRAARRRGQRRDPVVAAPR